MGVHRETPENGLLQDYKESLSVFYLIVNLTSEMNKNWAFTMLTVVINVDDETRMKRRKLLLVLPMIVILLVSGFGCQTPIATKSPAAALTPSTPAVSPPNPVTPSAVQPSTTPSQTPKTTTIPVTT